MKKNICLKLAGHEVNEVSGGGCACMCKNDSYFTDHMADVNDEKECRELCNDSYLYYVACL